MSIEVYPPQSGANTLNQSQVFTSSGTWTVPSGVTSAHVFVHGGRGTKDTNAWGYSTFSSNSASGGTSSVESITAPGGFGGSSYANNGNFGGVAPTNGEFMQGFISVTPGSTITVIVGSGQGACAVISWSGS